MCLLAHCHAQCALLLPVLYVTTIKSALHILTFACMYTKSLDVRLFKTAVNSIFLYTLHFIKSYIWNTRQCTIKKVYDERDELAYSIVVKMSRSNGMHSL